MNCFEFWLRYLKEAREGLLPQVRNDKENYTRLIFETLKPLQKVAIRNAKKLLDYYGEGHNPESDNPSTRVHLLLEVLNSLVSSS